MYRVQYTVFSAVFVLYLYDNQKARSAELLRARRTIPKRAAQRNARRSQYMRGAR